MLINYHIIQLFTELESLQVSRTQNSLDGTAAILTTYRPAISDITIFALGLLSFARVLLRL